MLNYQAEPLEQILAPLSKNQIMVVLEALDPDLCDEMGCSLKIMNGLGMNMEEETIDQFTTNKYLIARADINPEIINTAEEIVDYFRQTGLRNAVRALFFLDEMLIETSGDHHPSMLDLLQTL